MKFISIGQPIANTVIYILDSHLQLKPIGIPGELYIGGDGLARGYFKRPELTREKFIDNPFGEGRLYKTGDLARYLPDGNIEFLGRIDHQVKIRGFRIELGEIENTLSQYEGIQEAVVIAKTQESEDKYLVAYYISSELSTISPQQLREFLQQKLPDYMIPSAFVSLDKFPLTPNGKRDRAALPDPNFSDRAVEFIPPSTEIEKTIANIWSQVLSINEIGIQDNFFHLGGHSLLATQVVSRLRQTFQIEIPLIKLFEAPTIAQLAAEVEKFTQTVTEDTEDYEEIEI